ncbi:MAG: 50S ribosomal protein L31e [Candidatus Bathyarchaeota archaeon]
MKSSNEDEDATMELNVEDEKAPTEEKDQEPEKETIFKEEEEKSTASINEVPTEEGELTTEEKETEPPPQPEVDEEIIEERFFTIPLGKARIAPLKKRTPRAIKIIRSFIEKHMKLKTQTIIEEEGETRRLVISNEVNNRVWKRSIEKPPRRVRVRAVRYKNGAITVFLAEGD